MSVRVFASSHWVRVLGLLLVATLALGAVASARADDGPLTVADAVDRVLAHHPLLTAGEERILAAHAASEQAGAWANPEFELEAEGLGGARAWSDPQEWTLSIGLPVELFGTRGANAAVGEAVVARERAVLTRLQRSLVAETWWAFHRALAAEHLLDLARARAAVTARTARALAAEVAAGKVSPLQSLRGEVEHERTRAELSTALVDRRIAHQELAALWNAAVTDSLALDGTLRAEPVELDRDGLEAELLAAHPALAVAQSELEVERRTEHLTARERWPVLVPRAGVRWYGDTSEEDFVASLSLDLPVFDRGNSALTAAARRTAAAGHELEDRRRRLLTELRSRCDELEAQAARVRAYGQEIVPRADEALARVRIGHEHGKFGSLELLDAQRTWIAVQEDHARARIDHDAALVRLETLVGRRLDPLDAPPHSRDPEENRP